jgi:hypothetical protein
VARFPKDRQEDLIAYFGDPGRGETGEQLVAVVPPFKFTFGGRPFPKFLVHRKIEAPFKQALDKIWTYYGKDQSIVDRLKISRTAGTFNVRKIAGSNKWSNHSYGAAVDINSEENGFNTGQGTIPKPVVAAFKSEGFAWGGDYRGRTDPMHFEAVDRGEPERSFEQWLDLYGEPHTYKGTVPTPVPKPVPVPPKAPVYKPPRTVRLRNSGYDVRVIQWLMGVSPDGTFGSRTKAAVQQFQKAQGLVEDGVVGPQTWAKLKELIGVKR